MLSMQCLREWPEITHIPGRSKRSGASHYAYTCGMLLPSCRGRHQHEKRASCDSGQPDFNLAIVFYDSFEKA